ncbi:hypothetical protein [Desulfonema magnum]|uniref:Uncharacterized protein n=1 Tax=Desulfonema magnum TaxID=45655 RepID=A0A975BGA3_9BACT|nr:hypothetical protein [Desulfonema magnum]QTA84872.1 Uncharacterized protein dnm_008750 [Desulfonema magnum]
MHLTGDSTDTRQKWDIEGSSPRHQISPRFSLEIIKVLEFDLWMRYADELPAKAIDSYRTLDSCLAWMSFRNLELSVTGQHLLDDRHSEFSVLDVERRVYGKLLWCF